MGMMSFSRSETSMLSAPVATVLAAAIALVGTVIGLIIAHRKSKSERQAARSARFETDQQDLYKTLWQKVEDVNVALRRQRVDQAGFRNLVADLNEFMLRNGAHMEDSDSKLVNRYVSAVKLFHDAVSNAGEQAKVPYGSTQEIPPEVLLKARSVAEASTAASELRDQLRARVRSVLTGEE
jgi:hypothetical protein